MKVKTYFVGMLLACCLHSVTAKQWQCRNQDMEITCGANNCVISKGFTPMDIHIDDKGEISVCLYSGCWQGSGHVVESGHFMMLATESLKFSTSQSKDMYQSIVVVLDHNDNISVLKAGSYAMPVRCRLIIQEQ